MKNKYSWTQFRTFNFLIGLLFSILICLTAFQWTVYNEEELLRPIEPDKVEEIEIIRTAHPKKKLPPPPEDINIDERKEMKESVIFNEIIPETLDTISLEITDTFITKKTGLEKIVLNEPPPLPPEKENPIPEIVIRAQVMAYFGDCASKYTEKNDKKSCSDAAFYRYLGENIKYPSIARQNQIEGTVYLEIILDTDGSVERARILRDIGGGCGTEALRVIKEMPKWSTAKQNGRPVKLMMRLPVKFDLVN